MEGKDGYFTNDIHLYLHKNCNCSRFPISAQLYFKPIEVVYRMETMTNTTALSEFNRLLIRIETLCAENQDMKKIHFTAKYLSFVRLLAVRLPVSPIMSINKMKQIVFAYYHNNDNLNITIIPSRMVRCELSLSNGYKKSNIALARADYISNVIQDFYLGKKSLAPTPIVTYREATTPDYPYLSAILQYKMEMTENYSLKNIRQLFQYSSVARDNNLGILSFCGICLCNDKERIFYSKYMNVDFKENPVFKVSAIMTHDAFYGLGYAEKCLRKATEFVLDENPEAIIIGDIKGKDNTPHSLVYSTMKRCGYDEVKVLHGANRFLTYQCAHCAYNENNCAILFPDSLCNSFLYLNNKRRAFA